MKEPDIAYLAGLIDGEGTITLSRSHSDDKFRHPVVSIASTTKKLVEIPEKVFGGYISQKKTYEDHHKTSYRWAVHYNDATEAIEVVKPYLREPEKLRRAELILNYYKDLTPRNGKYTQQMKEQKLLFEKHFLHPEDYPKLDNL